MCGQLLTEVCIIIMHVSIFIYWKIWLKKHTLNSIKNNISCYHVGTNTGDSCSFSSSFLPKTRKKTSVPLGHPECRYRILSLAVVQKCQHETNSQETAPESRSRFPKRKPIVYYIFLLDPFFQFSGAKMLSLLEGNWEDDPSEKVVSNSQL